MLITRKNILKLGSLIGTLKKNSSFPIAIKYKILKLEKLIAEEFEISNNLLEDLTFKYAELSENNEPIYSEDGGLKIQAEKALTLYKEIEEFHNQEIQFPDYYFSLNEAEELQLDWEELEAFLPLIK